MLLWSRTEAIRWMYNKKWKAWEAPSYEESLLIWCREPFNRENPQALYMLADDALSRVERGKGTVQISQRAS